jgi:nicotinamidase-related amidase
MLDCSECSLVVIDVQVRLLRVIHEKDALIEKILTLIESAKILGVPIFWLQQAPHALGETEASLSRVLSPLVPIDKECFSCCGSDEFMRELRGSGRRQVLLCGIEAHVCVYQTAVEMAATGFEVHVAADAVSSRSPSDRGTALERLRQEGLTVNTTEMAIFEMLGGSRHPAFRRISRLLK